MGKWNIQTGMEKSYWFEEVNVVNDSSRDLHQLITKYLHTI